MSNTRKPVERVNKLAKNFPELSLLTGFLEDYSLREKHYNQIVVTDIFVRIFLCRPISSKEQKF